MAPTQSITDTNETIGDRRVLQSVESIVVLEPLVDVVHHRLFRDPEFPVRERRQYEIEIRNGIVSKLESVGIKPHYSESGIEERFRLQRLSRNLGNMTHEDIFHVTIPANATMANQLAKKSSLETLLISEFNGWTKADNLIRKEQTTVTLFNVITLGMVNAKVPAESSQRINMYLLDARTGVALWSGSAEGEIEASKEMTDLLLQRLAEAIDG